MTAHLGFERGKTVILVRGNIDFPGLSIPAQDTRKRGIKIKTEHRHPGIDTHARAVAELPSNAGEKVGTHRQPAIWEINGTAESGRASCRERVGPYGSNSVADVRVKKKKNE